MKGFTALEPENKALQTAKWELKMLKLFQLTTQELSPCSECIGSVIHYSLFMEEPEITLFVPKQCPAMW